MSISPNCVSLWSPERLHIDDTLHLRAVQLGDARQQFDLMDENRDYLIAAREMKPDTALGDIVRERAQLEAAKEAYRALDYWIVSDKHPVGMVGCVVIGRTASRGVWVAEAEQGKGLASQSTQRLTQHLIENGIRRVRALVFPDNSKSVRRLKREGATKVGYTTREVDGLDRPVQIWNVYPNV